MAKKIKKTNLFFKESVVLFGFLNGLFTAIGINPGAEAFSILSPVLERLDPFTLYLIRILPIALFFGSLFMIYNRARWLGFIAVVFGFAGGLFMLASPLISVLFLIAAWGIGYFGVKI